MDFISATTPPLHQRTPGSMPGMRFDVSSQNRPNARPQSASGWRAPQDHLWQYASPRPPFVRTAGWWRKTLRVAGLSDINLHDLRFYASGLIAAGCDVVTAQRSLGHAKATTTLSTYAHLWPTAEDRTRKAAQSIIDASLGDWDPNHIT
jgi:Phage integrase family